MLTVVPECAVSRDGQPDDGPQLPGSPWTVRLAGARSAWPALEIYEAGVLIDVVSSTRIAARRLRGARVAAGPYGPRALAWGRMPAAGPCPYVEFGSRGWPRSSQAGFVAPVVRWCWVAAADGDFAAVTLRTPEGVLTSRLSRSRPWC